MERNDDYSMHNLQAIIGVPGHKKSTMIALDDGEGNHSIPMKWGSYEPSRYDKFHASKKTIDELEKAADEILRDGGGFAPHGILPPALR
ncbi:hypothetical protein JCM19235_1937 [Vibrio maritimus]|uniref:Uncharacterized protein n=1 Tax=Vibrio maritimus TaxID=990268 RepID=A0A090RWF0_9VIBR|nr:hypothetical protein JCM19235_1937 [Vibrio maritimus]